MKRSTGIVIAAAVVVVLGVANAATRQDDGANDGRSGVIVLDDMRFEPSRLDAKVGVPMTVRLTNNGSERHDLNFPSLHMPGLEGVESILEPGETRTITLTFTEPGTHNFICSLPGHAAAGMTGAVFVTP
ncbi:MAG: cupredoxin domain-containing protein [Candidatus Limnocylindrales bacterium]